ncbi:MAG: cation-translocating P-type ATPase [Rhodoferax sp.]|nr:cation-translocating P-type ATPase [Rhodoferax sp.]
MDRSPTPAEPPQGLSQAQAVARLQADGANELGLSQRRSLAGIVWEVVREPMFLLLLGAGAIYLATGDPHEALVLLGFVCIIIGVTIVQERRTDNALEALHDLSSPRAQVIRDGAARRIPGREVVRADLLVLTEGDRVAADALVLEAHELACDESMLTGESASVAKQAGDTVFAGTMVVSGQALVQVSATGRHSEFGRIGQSLGEIEPENSPLRDEVARLTRRLVLIGVSLSLLLALLFWWLRGGWLDALLAGITLAMGILPQEFAVIMIVFMALGARRMAAHQVLTRRLGAIETLGQTTVLCVDKTGTLTHNRMEVAALQVGDQALDLHASGDMPLPEAFHELLEYAVLASEIEPHDPMEQAFHRLAGAQLRDTEHLHPGWALAQEYELSPQLLAMSHLWHGAAGSADIVATKGAPEAIADLCHLEPDVRARLAAQADAMADRGLRVLGVAKARHHEDLAHPQNQHDFEFGFLGLVGLADPLRAQVPLAVAECRRAGIRIVMITGDHPRTARAIAAQAGIDSPQVITGAELAGMDAAQLALRVADVHVFARVKPHQKLALIEALKARGDVVAMTGDGVNDAPALKAAHIGIAMGQRGTDVAREAAALVLLDDDFSAIVQAIRLGRRIFVNLRQAMVYTLAVHVPIIGLSLLPVLFGMPLLLVPLHIAFLELVIDPACSIVFEAQEQDKTLLEQPPRPRQQALLLSQRMAQGLLQGGVLTLVLVGLHAGLLGQGMPADLARSAVFVTLVTANAALILPSRRGLHAGWRSMFSALPPVTRWVMGGTLLALLLVTAVPALADTFRFAALSITQWLAAFALGLLMLAPFHWVRRGLTPA